MFHGGRPRRPPRHRWTSLRRRREVRNGDVATSGRSARGTDRQVGGDRRLAGGARPPARWPRGSGRCRTTTRPAGCRRGPSRPRAVELARREFPRIGVKPRARGSSGAFECAHGQRVIRDARQSEVDALLDAVEVFSDRGLGGEHADLEAELGGVWSLSCTRTAASCSRAIPTLVSAMGVTCSPSPMGSAPCRGTHRGCLRRGCRPRPAPFRSIACSPRGSLYRAGRAGGVGCDEMLDAVGDDAGDGVRMGAAIASGLQQAAGADSLKCLHQGMNGGTPVGAPARDVVDQGRSAGQRHRPQARP